MIQEELNPASDHLCVPQAQAVIMQDVSLFYENTLALDHISLTIASGQRVALVGPNGAGKSSLLHLLAGIVQPSSGRIQIHDHTPAEFLCTTYVTQSRNLDWNFPVSVFDVVMMGRTGLQGLFKRVSSADKVAVQHALERLNIQDLAQRQINELSGGQKQRMFIARALVQQAEIYLFDEPLTGLDLSTQERIFHVLDELQAEGATVLVSTHDLNLAEDQFDQILLLNRKLIGIGPAAEVLVEEKLRLAYGHHVQVVETEQGRRIVGDMGGHHAHNKMGDHA